MVYGFAFLLPVTMFLRIVAISVGLANIYIVGLIGGAPAIPTNLTSSPALLLATVLYAVVAGLVASEVVLRFMRPALRDGFFLRYIVMVLVVSLGGVIFGALVALGALFEGSLEMADRIIVFVVSGVVGALFGGTLGAVEGLILGLPLAAILGLFRNDA